jgi:hypothetical protein
MFRCENVKFTFSATPKFFGNAFTFARRPIRVLKNINEPVRGSQLWLACWIRLSPFQVKQITSKRRIEAWTVASKKRALTLMKDSWPD